MSISGDFLWKSENEQILRKSKLHSDLRSRSLLSQNTSEESVVWM